MFLKHLIVVPIIFIIAISLGWFGRPYVESKIAANETPSTTKVYQGFDFSFEYPVSYTASEKGLWSEGRYEISLQPPKYSNEMAGLPDIKIINDSFGNTVKEYFEQILRFHFNQPNNENLSFEEISLSNQTDGEKYYKVVNYEMLKEIYYVRQSGNRIVGFEIFDTEEGREPEILEMLGSLKFE